MLQSILIRVVLYLRMSSDRQDTSIKQQRQELQAYAARHGYTIVREYIDEGISGDATEKRAGFQQMLRDATELGDFEAILCWDQDRFGRFDPLEAGYWIKPLRDAGVRLETIAQGVINWNDFSGRIVYVAQQEGKHAFLRDLSRNILRGKLEGAKEAHWQGGPAPFGYRVAEDGRLVLGDHEKVEFVRWLFRAYAAPGASLRSVVDEANRKGIPSPRGGIWQYTTVRKLLRSPHYTGDFVWNRLTSGGYTCVRAGELKQNPGKRAHRRTETGEEDRIVRPGSHEAIIDRGTWEAVQRRLDDNREMTSPRKGAGFLLTGLISCANCGSKMHGGTNHRMRSGEKRVSYRFYVCSGYKNLGGGFCQQFAVSERALAACVVRKLQEDFLNPENIARLEAKIDAILAGNEPEKAKLKKAALKKRLAELTRQIDQGAERVLTAPAEVVAVLTAKLKEMQGQRDRLQAELEERPAGKPATAMTAKEVVANLWELHDRLQTSDPVLLREVIRQMVSGIECRFGRLRRGKRKVRTLLRGVIHVKPDRNVVRVEHNVLWLCSPNAPADPGLRPEQNLMPRPEPGLLELPLHENAPFPLRETVMGPTANRDEAGNAAPSRDLPVAVPSPEEFLAVLRDSRLLTPEELSTFLSDHAGLAEGETATLIGTLIHDGLLNDYHVGRLLAGQPFGMVFDNYRVLDRIGAAEHSIVYKAEHVQLKRPAVLKVFTDEEERHSGFLQRFQGMIQALAVLNHPGIVLTFHAGETESVPGPGPSKTASRVLRYLVREYVPGQDLERHVNENGPLPVERACDLIAQAAEGLRHAHEHGIVHAAIKPANLLLTPRDQVKVLDYGLRRILRTQPSTDYLAPEQLSPTHHIDIRTDIHGLGATFYFLLSGRKPYAATSRVPVPLRRLRAEVPLELEAIICQMMAHDPSDRYPTPLAFLCALRGFREAHGLGEGAGEQGQSARFQDATQTQDVLLFAMAKMAEMRGMESAGHLLRMQQYVRLLGEEAMRMPAFAGQIDGTFLRLMERCVVLHDIGKVAIPDHILLKPSRLTPEERTIVESHTVLGAEFLEAVLKQSGGSLGFLQMAIEIARSHHERWDGTGYPEALARETIPLAARITMFADVYDALRSKLVYKPGLPHLAARRLILESAGQFDPNLLVAFRHCDAGFQHVFESSEP